MSKYKYELAKELLAYFDKSDYDEKMHVAFQGFATFTEPAQAWAFLERADWLGTTLIQLAKVKKPASIFDWASFVKTRDSFTMVAECTTVGEAVSVLQDLIYAMEHGEQ